VVSASEVVRLAAVTVPVALVDTSSAWFCTLEIILVVTTDVDTVSGKILVSTSVSQTLWTVANGIKFAFTVHNVTNWSAILPAVALEADITTAINQFTVN